MSSTGWCFLFDIIHSVEREVSCKRQVLFIAFFLYNGIVDYWLFIIHLSRRGVMGICNLEFRLKSLKSKKISNNQELIQSDPISCPQNQKGNN